MKRFFIAALLIVCSVLNASAVDTSARSGILVEANTGEILYEKNINEKRPIASTTKIMTALLVAENCNLEDVVEIKKEQEGIEGTSLYLKSGEKITVRTLLYGLMLRSGNDAAEALAVHTAGDIESFVTMMNEKAAELKMENTHFENPHGLPNDNHYSTAYDMARLTAYAMKNDTFREVVSTKNYTAEGRSFKNHNKLLDMNDSIDGVKTGFTKAAGRCLVSSGQEKGMRLVAVTLFDPNDWDDHLNLYKFGFDNFKNINICKEGEKIETLSIAGYGNIDVVAEKTLIKTVSNDRKVKTEIYLPRFKYAPIEEGDVVGEMRIIENGTVTDKINLISSREVLIKEKENFLEKIWNKIINGRR